MSKSKIYTKTGDKGETGLVGGTRISKADDRIDLYGEVDELNSRVGFAASLIGKCAELDFLQQVQSALFDIGSNLACEVENREKYKLPQISLEMISMLEQEIDRLDAHLEPLTNFVLPGGSQAAASLHLCRTCARKVERKMIQYHLQSAEKLPENSLQYMNRLSDYFFVLARYINKVQGGGEVIWKSQK